MSKQSAYFTMPDALSAHEAKEVKKFLSTLPGVLSVAVGDGRDTVSVDYDSSSVGPDAIGKLFGRLRTDARLQTVDEHPM